MAFFLRLLERPQPWGSGPPGRAGPPEKQGTGLGGSPGPQPHLRETGRKETEHGASHCSLDKGQIPSKALWEAAPATSFSCSGLQPPWPCLPPGSLSLLPPPACSDYCPYPSGCQAKSHSPFCCGFRPCHFYWGSARGWRRPFSSTLSTGLS